MTELAQPIASITSRSAVERAAVVEARTEVALRRRTRKRILGAWHDQRAFADDIGQRVDFERLVDHRADERGVDGVFLVRIAYSEDERRRSRTLFAETPQEGQRFTAGKTQVDEDQRVIAPARFFERVLHAGRGIDAEGLMAKDGEEHRAKGIVVFDDENSRFRC